MPKHFSNSKQILHLARECRVKAAEIIQQSIASLPLLRGSLTNTEPVDMEIGNVLLLLDCSNILLNRGLRAMHSGFETFVKALHHVRGSGELRILNNSSKVVPEFQRICRSDPLLTVHTD